MAAEWVEIMGNENLVFQGLLFIIGFGAILFLAYITTRFIAGKSSSVMKGKYINIVETVSLGMDKRLHLVKVGEQFFIIASSGKTIKFLTNVVLEDFERLNEEQAEKTFNFKNFFNKYIQAYKTKRSENNEHNEHSNRNDKEIIHIKSSAFKENLNILKDINEKFITQDKKDGNENTNEK
jgi:flagellar protein FliO/FliZ